MNNKIIVSQERTPDGGYAINRIDPKGMTAAVDPLSKLNTQELTALSEQLDASDTAKQAYWGKFKRTHEEV
jgi:hypothetical protein